MKLSQLLHQREALLRQSRLANLAFAYTQLAGLVTRISDARLRGQVCLQPADPATEQYCPLLTAMEGSQAVIEEHFTDENISELADLISFLSGGNDPGTTFRLEEMAVEFLLPLQRKLEQAGVDFDQEILRLAGPKRGGSEANPKASGN